MEEFSLFDESSEISLIREILDDDFPNKAERVLELLSEISVDEVIGYLH